ncbi:MAG: DUF4190 domain-containing protein [Blastocatellia bacterium]
MKRCPRCGQTYTESDINFCLNDGELLSRLVDEQINSPFSKEPPPTRFADDSPPTLMMNTPRVTNQSNWQAPQPIQPWQPANVPQQQFTPCGMALSPNQTLAIVSLCLGIGSMTVGWCCSMGLALSPAALITGFIALSMIKKDPNKYGGRGFAIGGVVTGAVFLAAYLLFLFIYGAAILFGGLN